VALVVVVPGPGGPDPRSAGPGARRTDPAKRVVTALSSSLRAMRGQIPAVSEITVLDFADLFAGRSFEGEPAVNGVAVPGASGEPDDAGLSGSAGEAAELVDDLLRGWWTAATRIGQVEIPADRRQHIVEPAELSRALGASAYFRGSPELPAAEAQALSRYLTDLKLRHEARVRTQGAILPDTRVVVGHGLGALIAYEALCALSDAVSVTFVTLGAALCGPDQVFERLEPAPRNEQGQWPAAVRRWFNVVAHSDPTAMVAPQLTQRFGPGIEDEVIEIKSVCGDIYPYLLDRTASRALAAGLG
jgi:hypothetical protein